MKFAATGPWTCKEAPRRIFRRTPTWKRPITGYPTTPSPTPPHNSSTNATVSYNTSACPANNPPTTVSGLMVTGTAPTTANGGPTPFDPNNTSTLQVCIMGGSGVSYSNMTLVYSGLATTHFGSQPI